MAAASQSFTVQLNSATAEKTSASEERFQINLTPAVDVPYMAQPRAQLESIAFSNSFVNIAEHLGNNRIAFQLAYAQTTQDANLHYNLDAELSDKRYELVLPDGHYDATELELELAKQAYATHKASDKIVSGHATYDPPSAITPTTSLWSDMNILVTRKPFVNTPKTPGTGETANSEYLQWRFAENVAKGSRTIVLDARFDHSTKQSLAYHLIGATLSSASTGNGVSNVFAAGTRVTFVSPPVNDKQTIHLSHGVATAITSQNERDDTMVLVTPEAHYGYGVRAVAEPDLDPSSGWGQVLSADAMQLIAETKGSRANSIIPTEYIQKSTDDANPTAVAQKDRYVKPFYLSPDPASGRMRVYLSVPDIAVLDDDQAKVHGLRSNLIVDALGFADTDMAGQKILINRPGGTGKAWTASKPGRLLRTRSLQFHCPTFINSSYDNNGRRQGGLLADIPITVPPGYVQAWSAGFDNSVPAAVHGGSIDAVQFYITNQDGEALHNQGQTFQATLRLFWDDPV
eukprot:COSAG02_NODE_2303_length_9183_cov_6.229369_8_plen_515_part_01